MNDLEAFRDHARAMANWEPPPRPAVMSINCRRGHIYGDCRRPAGQCGCPCHDVLGPTPREQALWRQLADEVDAYLSHDDEPDLFWAES